VTIHPLNSNGSRNGDHRPVPAPLVDQPPPHNIIAEESTLGAAMLAQHATDWLLANLRAEDFYRPAHRTVFEAVAQLATDGSPVDATTVGAALQATGQLADVGGHLFLLRLVEQVPAVSNVGHYGRIVRAAARQRRIIDLGVRVMQLGFEEAIAPDRALGLAQGWLDELARDGQEIGLRPADLLDAIRERQQAKASGKVASWGIKALDDITEGLPPGNVIVLAAQTSMGKSSLAIQVAAHNADRGHVLYVTYEMTPADTGKHTFAQVAELGLAEATAFLDAEGLAGAREAHNALDLTVYKHYPDAARLLHEVRGLHARRPLSLVVVDYVQKVPAPEGRRYGTREQEVAEVSRRLKELAIRCDVPVLACAQLNRGAVGRRPSLADLRECVVGSTVLYDPASGQRATVEDLYRRGGTFDVLALDGQQRLVKARALGVIQSGRKPVLAVRTRTGRMFTASGNHPVLTFSGWRAIETLRPGDEIASPRRFLVDEPDQPALHSDQARLLGYLVSDGHYGRHRSVGFIAADEAVMADAVAIVREHFGVPAAPKAHWTGTPQVEFRVPGGCGPGRNPIVNWLRGLQVHGQLGPRKHTPDAVMESGAKVVANYLAGLYAGDGSVVRRQGRWVIKYDSTSMRLLREIQHLLLRLGVVSVLERPKRNSKSKIDIASLLVSGAEPVATFTAAVPIVGRKGRLLLEVMDWAAEHRAKSQVDLLPLLASQHAITVRCEQPRGSRGPSIFADRRLTRAKAARLGQRYGDAVLSMLAVSDVLWDQVVNIAPAGEEVTYDLVVPGLHNFVANDVILHNSGALEQDADFVLFIHKDERASTTADLLLEKNRMGPVDECRLRWHSSQATFGDL
jgi:replicative DNA helicase